MIDARTQHNPAKAPGLIQAAIDEMGSLKELSERVGVSRQHLRKLKIGESVNMSYPLQVVLENIVQKNS